MSLDYCNMRYLSQSDIFSHICDYFSGYAEDEDSGEGQETGTVFEDVDLSEKEWADYDEKSDQSVCISELQFSFVKVK